MDKVVLRRWLKAGFIDEGTLFATEAGTPQGGIISPVIANMTLDGLEAAVDASVGPTERARRKFKINVNRYADDFVVTGVSKRHSGAERTPCGQAIPGCSGPGTFGRENQSHPHCRWVRFPWAECPQVRGQAAYQTGQQKCEGTSGKGKENRETAHERHTAEFDRTAQPGDSGLGHVSPPCGLKISFYVGRCSHLAPLVEMGDASAPHERRGLGEKQILPRRGEPYLGVYCPVTSPRGNPAVSGCGGSDCPSREGTWPRQSV
ncbi:hypothetical protein OKW35_009103 [Paraburkholderia sp. MM5477-R1]